MGKEEGFLYRLTVNTIIPTSKAGKTLKLEDPVVVLGK